jgi:hypothetical protein
MKPRHSVALALVGASSIAIVFVFAEHTRGVRAPQPIPTSSTRASWCPQVPASPAPPYFDGHYGTWAEANKRCLNVTDDHKDQEECGDLCMAARDLWNMKKLGLLDKPDTFPQCTDKTQGPFPLPGGANGYILPCARMPAPTSDSSGAVSPVPSATTANPNWCSDVPASPAPPDFEIKYGHWDSARKMCTSKWADVRFCADLCLDARQLWNIKKSVSWYLMVPTSTKSQTGSSVGAMKRLTFDSCMKCADYRDNLIDVLMLAGFPRAALAVSSCTHPGEPSLPEPAQWQRQAIGELVSLDSYLDSYWLEKCRNSN